MNSYIYKRIEELNKELVGLVEEARASKAQYEELINLYKEIIEDKEVSEDDANKIQHRAQTCFNSNQEAIQKFNEKKAVIDELQKLLEK